MADRPLGLEIDDYWEDPWKTLSDFGWNRIGEGGRGVVIDLPAEVDTDKRATIPLLAYYSGTRRELAEASFLASGWVTIMDLRRSQLSVGSTRPEGVPIPSGEVDPRVADDLRGESFSLDLVDDLFVSLEPTRLLVAVVIRDQVSNRLAVQVGEGPGSYQDPEVKRFLEEQRGKRAPRLPLPPLDDPRLNVSPEEPLAAPTEPGVRLEAPRVVVAREGESAWLRVAYRVSTPPADAIGDEARPDWEAAVFGEAPEEASEGESADERPVFSAVAAMTLLFVGSKDEPPVLIELVVPTSEEIVEGEDDPIVTGAFELDLLRYPQLADNPQTYWIYAFSGEVMSPPTTFAVVSEDQLPVG